MKHIAYTLGIYFFSQGLHAKNQSYYDTNFSLQHRFVPAPNPWTTTVFGYQNPCPSKKSPGIFCNFRNLPLSNTWIGNIYVSSSWLIRPAKMVSRNSLQNPQGKRSQIQLQTQHKITQSLGVQQQDHSIQIQLPISKKNTVFTGFGLIHTNQYGYTESLPISGKIQWYQQLNSETQFLMNAWFITSANPASSNTPTHLYTIPESSKYLYSSTLSVIEAPGIGWYYPQSRQVAMETAILIQGQSTKIPCYLKTQISNRGVTFGIGAWIPVNLSFISHVELSYGSGEVPIGFAVIGHTKRNFNNTVSATSINWKIGVQKHNQLGIIPSVSAMYTP